MIVTFRRVFSRRAPRLQWLVFLGGAFCEAKMSDSCSDPSFFLQTTYLTFKGPLFTETTKTTRPTNNSSLRKRIQVSAKGPLPFFPYFNVTYKTE